MVKQGSHWISIVYRDHLLSNMESLLRRSHVYTSLIHNFVREMLICILRAHVKDSINRNYVSEIVLIYCLKNIILIFFI